MVHTFSTKRSRPMRGGSTVGLVILSCSQICCELYGCISCWKSFSIKPFGCISCWKPFGCMSCWSRLDVRLVEAVWMYVLVKPFGEAVWMYVLLKPFGCASCWSRLDVCLGEAVWWSRLDVCLAEAVWTYGVKCSAVWFWSVIVRLWDKNSELWLEDIGRFFCEYIEKLRTFLDRDTPFEEVRAPLEGPQLPCSPIWLNRLSRTGYV
jgi:hypothetical protein